MRLRQRRRVSIEDEELVEAALGAPPGSAAAIQALATADHAALRRACGSAGAERVRRILAHLGPPGSAAVMAALAAGGDGVDAVAAAAMSGNADVVAVVLAAHGLPGCAAVASSARRAIWSGCETNPAIAETLVAAFGPPGAPATLANLAFGGHRALLAARCAHTVKVLVTAYGGPGAPALRKALAGDEGRLLLSSTAVAETWLALFDAFGAAPGSADMLSVLRFDDHALLRSVVARSTREGSGRLAKLEAVLEAYGAQGCAAVLTALAAGDHAVLLAAARGRSPTDDGLAHHRRAVAAVLRHYGPAGCAAVLEGLAAGGHAALLAACTTEPIFNFWQTGERRQHLVVEAVLEAYGGGPGSAAVLAALIAGNHAALRASFEIRDKSHVMQVLLQHYGPPGCPSVLAALAATDAVVLIDAFLRHHEVALIAAYGRAGRRALLAALLRRPLRRFMPSCPFAMLAVQLPEMWRRRAVERNPYELDSDEDEPPAAGAGAGAGAGTSGSAALPGAATGAATLRRDVAGRLLVSQHEKRAMVLPLLRTVRRLPPQVAEPVLAYLKAHPWSLYGEGALD
jgi:hypothetical protein